MSDDPTYPDLQRRFDYEWGTLGDDDLGEDPLAGLRRWLADAEASGSPDFNAMAVCTVDADGQPTARNLLLRAIGDDGQLCFFTNRHSRKGLALEVEPRVCLLFSWLALHRQVRVEGRAVPLGDDESDDYFATRPRDSRIAAWASEQSEVITGRDELDANMAECTARFGDGEVPRPPHWGGYAVEPTLYEFWQGRPSRLHDRLQFRRDATGSAWIRERLAP